MVSLASFETQWAMASHLDFLRSLVTVFLLLGFLYFSVAIVSSLLLLLLLPKSIDSFKGRSGLFYVWIDFDTISQLISVIGLESWPNLQRCFWRGFSSNLGGTRSSLITPFAIQPHFAKGFMMTANRKKQMDEEVEVDT